MIQSLSHKLRKGIAGLRGRDRSLDMDSLKAKNFYGQFGEDACLFSYFALKQYETTKNLSVIEKGFYVDIGAYDPVSISNTFVFHQSGWRGINVDISGMTIDQFNIRRPNHINLQIGISDVEGTMPIYAFGHPSVFNTLDVNTAQEYAKRLKKERVLEEIKTIRLESLFEKYLPPHVPIDFMSIDTEGNDLKVLLSNDWERFRPELVVAENHARDIRKILDPPIAELMQDIGYKLRFWTPPSLVFVDSRRPEVK